MANPIVASGPDVIGEGRTRLTQLHAVVQVAQDPRGESLATMASEMQSALLSLVEDRIIEIRELMNRAAV